MKLFLSIVFSIIYVQSFSQNWPNSKFEKTESGLKYYISEKKKSVLDTNISYIYFRYVWYTSSDKKIKLSTLSDNPLKFDVNSNKFVSGFNEALKMLNVGEKGFFIIPKSLAYGEKGIEGEKELYYYIEIVDRN